MKLNYFVFLGYEAQKPVLHKKLNGLFRTQLQFSLLSFWAALLVDEIKRSLCHFIPDVFAVARIFVASSLWKDYGHISKE